MENPFKQLTVRERSGLAVGAAALAGIGLVGWAMRSAPSAPLPMESAAHAASERAPLQVAPVVAPESVPSPAPSELVVYVSGAVQAPGVYRLTPGARVYQAIHKAGGFRTRAQKEALNLAAPVMDADQLHVPLVAEAAPEPEPQGEKAAPAGRVLGKPAAATKEKKPAAPTKFKKPGDGTVKLNAASAAELTRLPGVGPALAERILAYRKEKGKFESVDQLGDVKGIGAKKLESLRPFLALN